MPGRRPTGSEWQLLGLAAKLADAAMGHKRVQLACEFPRSSHAKHHKGRSRYHQPGNWLMKQ